MLTTLVVAVILFCLLMGATALVAPERIAAIHETPELTAAGRNEIRAVYGGFGVLMPRGDPGLRLDAAHGVPPSHNQRQR